MPGKTGCRIILRMVDDNYRLIKLAVLSEVRSLGSRVQQPPKCSSSYAREAMYIKLIAKV